MQETQEINLLDLETAKKEFKYGQTGDIFYDLRSHAMYKIKDNRLHWKESGKIT